jgi:ribonuclease HI
MGTLLYVNIFTDGSARNNGSGPGGWAAVLKYGENIKEISGGVRMTTNNRMELRSVIEAIKCLKRKGLDLQIYSDSTYVVNSISKGWLNNWVKTNFKGKANADLWQEYLQVSKDFNITMIWVKGHATNEGNNRCDQLATTASSDANKANWCIDIIYENLNKKK